MSRRQYRPQPGFMALWGLAEMSVDWQGIACPDGGSLCQVKGLVEGKLDVLQASACVWAAAEPATLVRMRDAGKRRDDPLSNQSL